jgi:hypothetical protein
MRSREQWLGSAVGPSGLPALWIEHLRGRVVATPGRGGLLGFRDRALVLLGFAAALRI